ncbi:MAG TPA: radical SAM protein, partial [Rhodospirillaceae bacterium]|nr:radical SAM protein [Rhodospirillaceae bacterium]
TDPYQPIERQMAITRQILQIMAETRHPVGLITKSDLVTRDIDLLADLARDNLVHVGMSVTTLDPKLARIMEPRASTPA